MINEACFFCLLAFIHLKIDKNSIIFFRCLFNLTNVCFNFGDDYDQADLRFPCCHSLTEPIEIVVDNIFIFLVYYPELFSVSEWTTSVHIYDFEFASNQTIITQYKFPQKMQFATDHLQPFTFHRNNMIPPFNNANRSLRILKNLLK